MTDVSCMFQLTPPPLSVSSFSPHHTTLRVALSRLPTATPYANIDQPARWPSCCSAPLLSSKYDAQ